MGLQVRRPRSEDAVSSSQISYSPPAKLAAPTHCTETDYEIKEAKTSAFTEGTTQGVASERPRRGRRLPTSSDSGQAPRPQRQELLSPGTAPVNSSPPLTNSPTSPGSSSTRGWLRETSGRAVRRATPPKAQSCSASFRSPAQTRLGRSASCLRAVPRTPEAVPPQPPALHAGNGLPPLLRDFIIQKSRASQQNCILGLQSPPRLHRP